MIYQENKNNCSVRESGCCGVSKMVIGFLALVFAFALGLILGAVFYETFLPVLASVIAFAAAILVVAIALLIYRCRRRE